MSPEFGSTCAIFPIDAETIDYLRLTGRSEEQIALVEAYAKEQGLWHDPATEPVFSEYIELDLGTVVPSHRRPEAPAGPHPAVDAKRAWRRGREGLRRRRRPSVDEASEERFPASDPPASQRRAATAARAARRPAAQAVPVTLEDGTSFELDHGAVVIAAITSCTNTSNPYVMLGAALLARNAVDKGLTRKPWVKTSLAPGSQVVTGYFERVRPQAVPREARLQPGRLRLHHLHRQLRAAARADLRGDPGQRPRGDRGALRQPQLRGPDQPGREDELPRLAAARGRVRARRHDGHRLRDRADRHRRATASRCSCATSGRRRRRSPRSSHASIGRRCSRATTPTSSRATSSWQSLPVPTGDTFEWDPDSTYVRKAPYFDGMPDGAGAGRRTSPAPGCSRCSATRSPPTTSRPAGAIKPDSPGRQVPAEQGVEVKDFNSYGSRRGNHEVMIRGTFANIRLRNQLAPGTEGGYTRDFTRSGEQVPRSTRPR